jgi:hypothetical protein
MTTQRHGVMPHKTEFSNAWSRDRPCPKYYPVVEHNMSEFVTKMPNLKPVKKKTQ